MRLTIAIRVDVRDRNEGRRFFRVIKDQFENSPNVEVSGSITEDADEAETSNPG